MPRNKPGSEIAAAHSRVCRQSFPTGNMRCAKSGSFDVDLIDKTELMVRHNLVYF